MEYDIRITNSASILNCFDTALAEMYGYKGKFGYFTNCIENYVDLNKCQYGELTYINSHAYQLDNGNWYTFFLPESSIVPKKKKKKYRPYTLMEFTNKFTVGCPIKFRKKGEVGCERYLILNGYWHEKRDGQIVTYIYIGQDGYTLDELFNCYEWQKHYTEDFEPFGVEEC